MTTDERAQGVRLLRLVSRESGWTAAPFTHSSNTPQAMRGEGTEPEQTAAIDCSECFGVRGRRSSPPPRSRCAPSDIGLRRATAIGMSRVAPRWRTGSPGRSSCRTPSLVKLGDFNPAQYAQQRDVSGGVPADRQIPQLDQRYGIRIKRISGHAGSSGLSPERGESVPRLRRRR
jgi:hypothetical protein